MSTFRHGPLLAAPAVALLVVITTSVWAPETAPPRIHRFESGHRLVAAPSARVEVDQSPELLDIRLVAGEVMFDIDPDAAQAVRIQSGPVFIRVLGTVFTAERLHGATRVAVFEGSVAVAGGGPLSLLSPGDRWEGGPRHRVPLEAVAFEPRFEVEARWAADRRAQRASPMDGVVPDLPAVPDLAADGRLPTAPAAAGGDEPVPAPEDALRALADERFDEAVALADRALGAGVTADWLLIRGDAHRGLGRPAEAAADYTRAAVVGDRRDRAVAGLSAARVLGRELGRGRAARDLLISSGALGASSPVRRDAEALVEELARPRPAAP